MVTKEHADSVVVVTGGASGIGQAIATGFAEAGLLVIASDLNEMALRELQQSASNRRLPMTTRVADLRQHEQIEALFQFAAQQGPISVVAHCAGITVRKSLVQTTPEEFHDLVETNISGAFYCLRAAIQHMKQQSTRGVILVMTSINVYRPLASQAIYTATKAAIASMVQTLSCEVAPYGIRVNALAPGAINTPMNRGIPQEDLIRLAQRIPLGRLGTPQDLVGPALFLASSAAEYITGATLVVDGGLMATR